MCPAGGAIKGAFAARFTGGVGPNAPRPGPPPLLKKRPHTTSKNGPCLEHPLKSSSHLVTLVLLQWGNGKRSLYPRVQRSVYFWDTYKVRRCIIYIGGKKKKKRTNREHTYTYTHLLLEPRAACAALNLQKPTRRAASKTTSITRANQQKRD